MIWKLKLVKEQELSKSLPTTPRLTSGVFSWGTSPPASATNSTNNRCVLGSYRANIDPERPNQRVYSAILPKDYFEQVREANIDRIQLSRIEHNLSDIHQTVSNIFSSTPAASTSLSLNFNSSYSDSSNGTEISNYKFLILDNKIFYYSTFDNVYFKIYFYLIWRQVCFFLVCIKYYWKIILY